VLNLNYSDNLSVPAWTDKTFSQSFFFIFFQLRHEKVQLEHTLEQEQECLVNKLMRRIEKLETETTCKQSSLDNLRREKVELENTLEQEQEALVNKLWKRMDQLETEKR
jgi:coiled-coil domain-containing protein 6